MSGTAGTVAAGAVAVTGAVATGVTGAVTVTGAVATGVTGAAVTVAVTVAPGATTAVGPVGVAEESLSPPSSFLLTLLRREVGEYDSA